MFEKDPRTFSPEYKSLSPEQKAMVKLEITLTNFFKDFDRSINRWERIVYPGLLVMGMLALSGFYLIYHLTDDMRLVAKHVDPRMETNMDTMSRNIAQLSDNIAVMTTQVSTMASSIQRMEGDIGQVRESLGDIRQSMSQITTGVEEINQSVKMISATTASMGIDTRMLNQNVGRPLDFMNRFAPW